MENDTKEWKHLLPTFDHSSYPFPVTMKNDIKKKEKESVFLKRGVSALIEKFEKMETKSQREPNQPKLLTRTVGRVYEMTPSKSESLQNEIKPVYDSASQPKPPICSYVDDLYHYAYTAIQHYNLHQDDHVELVDPLLLQSFVTSDWRVGQIRHLGFVARTKKFPSQLKLFFAEIGSGMVVKICMPIEPGNPLVQIGCDVCHPHGVLYHPLVKYDWVGGYGGVYGNGRLSTCEASAKQFFSEAYTTKSTVEDLGIEDAYELEKTISGHASKALEKFNRENGTFYELSKLVSCTRFVCDTVSLGGIFWAHLTFVAEVKDRMDVAVHFFAEVGFEFDMVTTCVTIPTNAVSVSGCESRCAICRDVCPMFHPVGGYVAGRDGGTYADSLYKGTFRGVKSVLLSKDDEASHTARREFYESLKQ